DVGGRGLRRDAGGRRQLGRARDREEEPVRQWGGVTACGDRSTVSLRRQRARRAMTHGVIPNAVRNPRRGRSTARIPRRWLGMTPWAWPAPRDDTVDWSGLASVAPWGMSRSDLPTVSFRTQ